MQAAAARAGAILPAARWKVIALRRSQKAPKGSGNLKASGSTTIREFGIKNGLTLARSVQYCGIDLRLDNDGPLNIAVELGRAPAARGLRSIRTSSETNRRTTTARAVYPSPINLLLQSSAIRVKPLREREFAVDFE